MSTSFDPAAQLAKLSEKLNHLETDLEEKSSRLQQQRLKLQGLNENIVRDQTSEQCQLQAYVDKTEVLGALQARINSFVEQRPVSTTTPAEFKAQLHDSSDGIKPGKSSAPCAVIETAVDVTATREQAKADLRALQQQARSNKEALRQNVLRCKQRQYHISVLDSQSRGCRLGVESANLVVSITEAIRGEGVQLHKSIASREDSEHQIHNTIDILEMSLQGVQQQCRTLAAEEEKKAVELQEAKRAVAELLPRPAASGACHKAVPLSRGNASESAKAGHRPDHCPAVSSKVATARTSDLHFAVSEEMCKDVVAVEPAVQRAFYAEEPENPEAAAQAVHEDRSRLPNVQTSQVAIQLDPDCLSLPLTGAAHAIPAAHLVMRTVECKPLKHGMLGMAQVRLHEVYQTIDSSGNRRSQCNTRLVDAGRNVDACSSVAASQNNNIRRVSPVRGRSARGYSMYHVQQQVRQSQSGICGKHSTGAYGARCQHFQNRYSPAPFNVACSTECCQGQKHGVQTMPNVPQSTMQPKQSFGHLQHGTGSRLEPKLGSACALPGNGTGWPSMKSPTQLDGCGNTMILPGSNTSSSPKVEVDQLDRTISKLQARAVPKAVSRQRTSTNPSQPERSKRSLAEMSTIDSTSRVAHNGKKPKQRVKQTPELDVFGGRI